MSKTIHLSMDIRGALLNWDDDQMRGVFQDDDGHTLSNREAKLFLMDELAKGHKKIPCGECDNFSYQTGCKGHEQPSEKAAQGGSEKDPK